MNFDLLFLNKLNSGALSRPDANCRERHLRAAQRRVLAPLYAAHGISRRARLRRCALWMARRSAGVWARRTNAHRVGIHEHERLAQLCTLVALWKLFATCIGEFEFSDKKFIFYFKNCYCFCYFTLSLFCYCVQSKSINSFSNGLIIFWKNKVLQLNNTNDGGGAYVTPVGAPWQYEITLVIVFF